MKLLLAAALAISASRGAASQAVEPSPNESLALEEPAQGILHLQRHALIARRLEQLAVLLSDGYAVLGEQRDGVRFGPLLPDQGHTAVAVFSLEGFRKSNSHNDYLAVFAHVVNETGELDDPHEPYRLLDVMQIGGKGWRSFATPPGRVEAGVIRLDGLKYAESDALCCPSLPFTARFRFENGRLSELTSALATAEPEVER
jgi:hypothetical protein